MRRTFPANAAAVLAAYRAHDAASARARGGRHRPRYRRSACRWRIGRARRREHSRSPAYAYFFTRRQPYAPGITFVDHDPATAGAYHSAEIPYFLRTRESLNLFRRTRIWEDVDAALEEDMAALLLSFARDGEPQSTRVPRWPAFDAAQPRVVVARRGDAACRLAELRGAAAAWPRRRRPRRRPPRRAAARLTRPSR